MAQGRGQGREEMEKPSDTAAETRETWLRKSALPEAGPAASFASSDVC